MTFGQLADSIVKAWKEYLAAVDATGDCKSPEAQAAWQAYIAAIEEGKP